MILSTCLWLACGGGTGTDSGGGETVDSTVPVAEDVCETLGLTVRPFTDGAEVDDALYAVVPDFTVETTEGSWNFKENWSGCESYLFLQDEPKQARGWPTPVWERDHAEFLERLPANTHVFFTSVDSKSSDREEFLGLLEAEFNDAIGDLPAEEQESVRDRIHYVTERAYSIADPVGDTLFNPGWGTGIDRFQRLRYVGSYADLYRYSSSAEWFEPNLAMAANEPRYYNFEAERDDWMQAEDATVVPVFTGETVDNSHTLTAELPDAATLAGFDTLTLDCTHECVGSGEYGDCPAWDYMAYVFRCSETVEDNPHGSTACQPAVDEVLGACWVDGSPTKTTCASDEDCAGEKGTTVACVGHEDAIEADTLGGQCWDPGDTLREVEYRCKADGSGYDDLNCGCDTEIGRWITTYHREGRWVYDISPMIPLLADGGEQTFSYQTDGPYEVSLDLRFSNQGKAERPQTTSDLFSGGTINESYNDGREAVEVDIPAEATRVELATVISQHGADGNNCGEFCDLCHHFTFNGDESAEIVRCFPESTSTEDCMDQVSEGTVPNQYGTWWYGRAGWCPGKEVPTVVHDITDQVVAGETASIAYRGLTPSGKDYTGSATIRMRSWLVISY